MLLVIDVGNTNFVLGLYKKEKLVKCWRMTTGGNRTADETGIFIHGLFDAVGIDAGKVEAVIISSVVPDIMYSLTQGIRKYFNIEPMIVGVGMKTGIVIKRDDPKSVGSDRIVDLVAANEIYGGPAIVIDYGTANTFDVINEKSECRKSKLRHRSPSLRKTRWTAFRQGLCWGISGRRNISSSS